MAGSGQQFVYGMGVTQVIFNGATAVAVTPPSGCMGVVFGPALSNAATMAVVQGFGSTVTTGWIMGATETVTADGPARFFLSVASGSTGIARVMFRQQAGYSILP